MAATRKKEPIPFEQATARLEEIIDQLDNSETGLEEMIRLVEEGLSLIRDSKNLLRQAELRIRTLENPEEPEEESTPTEQTTEEDGFNLL